MERDTVWYRQNNEKHKEKDNKQDFIIVMFFLLCPVTVNSRRRQGIKVFSINIKLPLGRICSWEGHNFYYGGGV